MLRCQLCPKRSIVNDIPVKIIVDPSKFYVDSKADSVIYMLTQRIWNSPNKFENKEHNNKTHISWFQDLLWKYINTVWYQCKDKQIEQWNRTESSEIDSYTYDQLFLTEIQRQFRQKIVFSTCGAGTINTYIQKKINLDLYLEPLTNINSKLIIDTNIKAKILKFYKKM